jgi:hypothetical protein
MFRLREFAGVAAVALTAMGVAQLTIPPRVVPAAMHRPTTPRLVRTAPPSKDSKPLTVALRVSPPTLPPGVIAAVALPPQILTADAALDGTPTQAVAQRLIGKVPASLAPYFDVFLYVSKAGEGVWAQHLYAFRKNADATLSFEQSFAVSTGRERDEQYFTATPTGLFELDSHRFVPMAYSAKWNDAQMPWAMFLNYAYRNAMTGVALHAAIGGHELADLGHRASGGCVRLPIDKADAFFHRFQSGERGQVPVLAFDWIRGTTNVDGTVVHDDSGKLLLADGVRVLVIIDDYGGPASPQS